MISKEAAGQEVLVPERLVERGDQRAAAVRRLEDCSPGRGGTGADSLCDGLPGRLGIAPIVPESVRQPDRPAKHIPELLLQGADRDEPTVLRRVKAVARAPAR